MSVTLHTCAYIYTYIATSTSADVEAFLGEIALMAKVSVGVNPHVVTMVGCIISERPLSLIMEYVPLGDLRSCLLAWKPNVRQLAAAVRIAVLFIAIALYTVHVDTIYL